MKNNQVPLNEFGLPDTDVLDAEIDMRLLEEILDIIKYKSC